MTWLSGLTFVAGSVVFTLILPATAAADHATRPHTQNIHAKGHSPHSATFFRPASPRDG